VFVTEEDIERLTSSSMDLLQDATGHLWDRKFGRFENYQGDNTGQPPRRPWRYGYWLEDGWAPVMFFRQYLIDNGHEFEIFYDLDYPTNWGGWVIMTDYASEGHRRHPCKSTVST
jgi:hypothetical protein